MDLVGAYVEPLRDGIGKGDILEFLTVPLYAEMDLFSFLRHRCFIALEEDFVALFLKYSRLKETDEIKIIEGYQVLITNLKDVEPMVLDARIMKIIRFLKEYKGEESTDPNLEIKSVYYNAKSKNFSYLRSV